MILALELLFWISAAWLIYVFVGYPALMGLLARVKPRPIRKDETYLPRVALVMAAWNEEKVIGRRLENYLELDYPRDRLRFLIGSDASTDRTDEIVREFARRDPSIALRRFERSGKTGIVYGMASELDEEVLIFTDADVLFAPNGLRRIVACFADPDVGGVTSRILYEDSAKNAGSVGEKTYHGIEDGLRRNESIFHTTVAPTGQCFAVRNGAYTPLVDYRMSDDLNLAITVPLNGRRVWYEPESVVWETNRRTLWTEFRRRLRMGQQSMATFLRYDGTRWPWRSLVGFQIWSHKVLRNLGLVPVVLSLVTSVTLAALSVEVSPLYAVAAIVWGVWIALCVAGLLLDRMKVDFPVLGYPLYFTLMLAALGVGSIRALVKGGGLAMWTSQRID